MASDYDAVDRLSDPKGKPRMSTWTEATQLLWDANKVLKENLASAFAIDNLSEFEKGHLIRLQAVADYVERRLLNTPRVLMPATLVGSLPKDLDPLLRQLQEFVSNRSPLHLDNVQAQADQLLASVVGTLPILNEASELQLLVDTANAFQSILSPSVKLLELQLATQEVQRAALEVDLARLTAEVATLRSNSTALVAETQNALAAAVEARRQEFVALETAHQDRFNRSLEQWQNQFSTAQESRSQQHSESQQTRETRFADMFAEQQKEIASKSVSYDKKREELLKAERKKFEEASTVFASESEGVLDKIRLHRSEVEKLVGVIGELGVTSGHQLAANAAHRSVRLWQLGTIGALIVLAGLATLTFFAPAIGDVLNWPNLAARMYLSVTLGAVAAYSASQAARYQHVERRNRKMELELKAIGPLLAPVAEDERQRFLLTIADRSFGHQEQESPDKAGPTHLIEFLNTKEGKNVLEILRMVVNKK